MLYKLGSWKGLKVGDEYANKNIFAPKVLVCVGWDVQIQSLLLNAYFSFTWYTLLLLWQSSHGVTTITSGI
jgi:hypothetical protein